MGIERIGNSRVVTSVMVKVQVPKGPEAPLTGKKPELKPPSKGSQGVAKLDWATVWLPGLPSKMKVTVELTSVTLMVGGSNLSPAVPLTSPTLTCDGYAS